MNSAENQNDSKPDHHVLGRELGIYTTDPLVGSGLPLWLPAGSVIRDELETLARELAKADGCIGVRTPVLGKRALFEKSGHWAKFADDMFPPMQLGDEAPEDQLVLRPANCPHHAMVYAARAHSYRELPVRLHELAPMFRAERSGVVSGLTRVRQISLDDTHVFCRPDQVAQEAASALSSALYAQHILGMPVDHVRLSLRDDSPGYLGDERLWAEATDALRQAAQSCDLARHDLSLVEAPGEAAFYGPKLDLQVIDRNGHGAGETIATVQLDFVQPERFDLRYDGADGESHRVVMIHRGTVGSMERVTAELLERYGSRLPLWLSQVQLCVLPVSEKADEAAREFAEGLRGMNLRVEVDMEGSLGARIRASRTRRDYAYAVIGEAEVADESVQITDPNSGWQGSLSQNDALETLAIAYLRREAPEWPGATAAD